MRHFALFTNIQERAVREAAASSPAERSLGSEAHPRSDSGRAGRPARRMRISIQRRRRL